MARAGDGFDVEAFINDVPVAVSVPAAANDYPVSKAAAGHNIFTSLIFSFR